MVSRGAPRGAPVKRKKRYNGAEQYEERVYGGVETKETHEGKGRNEGDNVKEKPPRGTPMKCGHRERRPRRRR